MRIWHFSDTHTYHGLLDVPENIDIAIFTGDCSNPRDIYHNAPQVLDFLYWYSRINARYKVFIPGNHDTSIEAKFVTKGDFKSHNIIRLENNSVDIEGIKIWGSPITPTFGFGWAYNRNRDKLHKLWMSIPEDTDIIAVHGPPKGILDLSYNRENILEFCGCSALKKRMLSLQPKLCLFGHIHNTQDIINAGYVKFSDYKTIFSNGSVVTDGKFGKVSSNGNVFEI